MPHLTWLARGTPRDDKVLTKEDVESLLADEVIVEEKIDGANLGFSITHGSLLRAQNRGQYLVSPYPEQFFKLPKWLEVHSDAIAGALKPNLIIFGEWCEAKHTVSYNKLPDWFVAFDIYDRSSEKFWNTERRDAIAAEIGLAVVPTIFRGKLSVKELTALVNEEQSRFGSSPIEGVVVRKESGGWCELRAKLVRQDFVQGIDQHWRTRRLERNSLR